MLEGILFKTNSACASTYFYGFQRKRRLCALDDIFKYYFEPKHFSIGVLYIVDSSKGPLS